MPENVQLSDTKIHFFGLQVTRLEGQVTRYKSASENAEKVEDELKADKRKLQREVELIFVCFFTAKIRDYLIQ